MSEAPRIVTLIRARSASEAQVIVAVLRGAGIPAYVDGALLQDEFAASQRTMGLVAVDIQVPRDALDNARQVLADARSKSSHFDRLDDELPEDELRRN